METWKKNLYAIAIAEFLVLMAFSFVNPFMPLFIQQLGDFTDREAALWAGIATGAAGVAMFFSAPLWGIMSDRLGRKPMVLRAQFGGAVVFGVMGLSPNVFYIVGLRFAQGLLTGTIAAASALVASQTPRNRLPFAMGLLMVGAYGGTTMGPFVGGVVADSLGFRSAFFMTGILAFCGGLIALLFVKEKFDRNQQKQRASVGSVWRLATSREILPLLAALCALQAGTQVLGPVIPLFIQAMEPQGEAATASGIAFGFMGILAALSAIAAGRLGTRISLKKILVFSCLGTALLNLPPIWAGTVTQLIIFIVLTGLLKGGFMTSANALVGLAVPGNQQGIAYGIAQSAQALGNGIGPLMGGILATLFGFKSIFVLTSGLFVLVGALAGKMLSGRPLAENSTRRL